MYPALLICSLVTDIDDKFTQAATPCFIPNLHANISTMIIGWLQ